MSYVLCTKICHCQTVTAIVGCVGLGSGCASQLMGWVGSGHAKWTHGPLCSSSSSGAVATAVNAPCSLCDDEISFSRAPLSD